MQTESLSTAVRVGRAVGVVVAIAIWETFARHLFSPPPGGGFNVLQFLCAGLMGGAGAVVGGFIGNAVSSNR
jgi:hypothetical protein